MGKANNLKSRVLSYLGKRANLGPQTAILVSKIASIDHTVVESELEALLLEANLIKKYEPPFNVAWKDGKAYPFIKITIKDTFPAVLQVRKVDDPKALFFGPFPNIGDVRRILKWARHIFPYQSVKKHPNRQCLYFHLDLCPCLPSIVSAAAGPPTDVKKEIQKYKKNINHIIQFLEGKKLKVIRALEKEMYTAAKNEDFEIAASIKKQLDTIELITRPIHIPLSYIDNPNLVSDEAYKDIESLLLVLKQYFGGCTPKGLSRIECYDISNISGKEATGSMVVATEGQIDKSQYRRFKIRFKDTPDDVAMHREMLMRRLKHKEWPMPDLIVIDGGITQANIAATVVAENNFAIPVIGLAKRLEEIVIPASRGNPSAQSITLEHQKSFQVIRLERNHRGLQLLQRLRDEAHRFAISYHRKLRRKFFLAST